MAVGDMVYEGRTAAEASTPVVLTPRAASEPGTDTTWAKVMTLEQVLNTPLVQRAIARSRAEQNIDTAQAPRRSYLYPRRLVSVPLMKPDARHGYPFPIGK